MTSKFEQLIELVINEDEAKAKELFHDIVVEKSREIYESLMNEEDDAERDDKAEEAGKKVAKDIEYDELHEEEEELDETIGGDASDDLMADVESEEEGMTMENDAEFDDEAEEAGDDFTHDVEAEHDAEEGGIEDRVVDLEDKLDELMAEFEAMMGNDEVEDEQVVDIDGGDALEMDDTDTAEFSDEEALAENVKLQAAPKPVTSEPAGTNTKSINANNSGAVGAMAQPVKMTGDTAQGRPAPKTGDLPEAGKFRNVPGKGSSNAKLDAAPKPVTAQAAGVNTKTPFPKA